MKTGRPRIYRNKASRRAANLLCVRKYNRSAKGRATYKRITLRRQSELRHLVDERKSKGCADCHQSFPSCAMDFDHVRGIKHFNIGKLLAKRSSSLTLIKEMSKCDVVCANCHRIRTWRRWQNNKESKGRVVVDPQEGK